MVTTGRAAATRPRERPQKANGTYAARNHNGCVASRAPLPSTPGSPPSAAVVISTATDQHRTTAAASPTSVRKRVADRRGDVVALAHPPAAKNTGMGAAAARNDHSGYSSSMLVPRTAPMRSRSMTAIARCPATTNASARIRATSIASRRSTVAGARSGALT